MPRVVWIDFWMFGLRKLADFAIGICSVCGTCASLRSTYPWNLDYSEACRLKRKLFWKTNTRNFSIATYVIEYHVAV